MNQKEIVYETTPTSYSRTVRSSDHPTIVAAKLRNVQLPYRICNEIFKGPSFFANAQAEQYYNNYMNMNRAAKNQMNKSQITMDSSQCHENYSFIHQSAKSNVQRRQNNSDKIKHFSPITEGSQQNHMATILSKSSNDESFFKSGMEDKKSSPSLSDYYLQTVQNNAQRSTSNRKKKLSQSCIIVSSQEQEKQQISKNLFKPQFYNQVSEVYSENESQEENTKENEKTQIQRLKKLLLEKDREILKYKNELSESNKRQKHLQERAKSAEKKHTGQTTRQLQNKNKSHEPKKQLGGTIPALMYMTLFMVLLTKHTINQ